MISLTPSFHRFYKLLLHALSSLVIPVIDGVVRTGP